MVTQDARLMSAEELGDWKRDVTLDRNYPARTPLLRILAHAAALQERLEAAERGEWREIESAPKDETWILLWLTDDGFPAEPRVQSAFWSEEYDNWFDCEAANNPVYGRATHWMPLPSPPKEKP